MKLYVVLGVDPESPVWKAGTLIPVLSHQPKELRDTLLHVSGTMECWGLIPGFPHAVQCMCLTYWVMSLAVDFFNSKKIQVLICHISLVSPHCNKLVLCILIPSSFCRSLVIFICFWPTPNCTHDLLWFCWGATLCLRNHMGFRGSKPEPTTFKALLLYHLSGPWSILYCLG